MSYKVGATTVIDTSGNIPWSQIAGKPAIPSVTDISLLYLYAAENKGNRLNMVGGIMDPFGNQTDLATTTNLGVALGKMVLAYPYAIPPNMTSNTVPTPITVSQQTPRADTWYAFDGTSTYQVIPNGEWTECDLGVTTAISGYNIRYGLGIYGPISWTFEGSSDGITWTLLDTQTNVTAGWVLGVDRAFNIIVTSYRYYRWNASASQSGAGASSYVAGYSVITPPGSFPTTMISNSFTASAVPTTCRLGVQATGVLTINTDLIGYVSRDGGTTWATATLVLIDTLADGASYYEDAAVSVAAQPSGTAMQYKIVTTSTNWTSTDGVLLQWS